VLQITTVHRAIDSEIAARGKGVGNCHQDALYTTMKDFTEAMAISVNSLKEHDAQEWKQTIIYDIAEDRKSVKTVLYVNLLILIVMVIATLYAFYRAS
jgi:hypothetical protein